LLDDAVYRREPEACALPLCLRREERLERAAARVGIHADARVVHGKRDVVATRNRRFADREWAIELCNARRYAQRAAAGHRIARIDGQVDEHLLELAFVRDDRAGLSLELDLDRDVGVD